MKQEKAKTANGQKAAEWLQERGTVLAESFASTLCRYAKAYQKENGIRNLGDVYKAIGTNKQSVSWWKSHPCGMQTVNAKRKVINSASGLFSLTEEQAEELANKAGFSMSEDADCSSCLCELLQGQKAFHICAIMAEKKARKGWPPRTGASKMSRRKEARKLRYSRTHSVFSRSVKGRSNEKRVNGIHLSSNNCLQ